MTESGPTTAEADAVAEPARLATILWWAVAVAVVLLAAWDINRAMATSGGIGVGIGEAFPLLIPLGLAWWGKRGGGLGFGILAAAVVVVEIAVIRLMLG